MKSWIEDLSNRKYRTYDISCLISCLPKTEVVPDIIVARKFEIMCWVSEPRYNVLNKYLKQP